MKKAKKRTAVPYERIARLWEQGKTIADIARRVGRYDKDAVDPLHGFRNTLRLMHAGWTDSKGVVHRLPYRISRAVLRRAKSAR